MKERRGHRKLRLCNTKNYERKKYQKKFLVYIPKDALSVLAVSVPLSTPSLQVSLPLSAYTILFVRTPQIRQLSTIPEGTVVQL